MALADVHAIVWVGEGIHQLLQRVEVLRRREQSQLLRDGQAVELCILFGAKHVPMDGHLWLLAALSRHERRIVQRRVARRLLAANTPVVHLPLSAVKPNRDDEVPVSDAWSAVGSLPRLGHHEKGSVLPLRVGQLVFGEDECRVATHQPVVHDGRRSERLQLHNGVRDLPSESDKGGAVEEVLWDGADPLRLELDALLRQHLSRLD
mmetsp:Transcript_45837/g.113929  ORF Transcript_45837/g.113929 Transcript_45837/m.113929 type:complete len:206 (-) Transcript_45837:125-742(-)